MERLGFFFRRFGSWSCAELGALEICFFSLQNCGTEALVFED
jgi:hypothetical protein